MPQTLHIERHFTASEVVRDIVIRMSDGLTIPFALAAGLSGAVDVAKEAADIVLLEKDLGVLVQGVRRRANNLC